MTPPLPSVTGKQAKRIAEKAGFRLDRQTGSHAVLYRNADKRRVVIPQHAGKILKPKTLAAIIEDLGLSVEEFTRLL